MLQSVVSASSLTVTCLVPLRLKFLFVYTADTFVDFCLVEWLTFSTFEDNERKWNVSNIHRVHDTRFRDELLMIFGRILSS